MKNKQNCNRYIRYATAAYGSSMIDSANLLQGYNKSIVVIPCIETASKAIRKRKIARYLNLDVNDIKKLTPPGGNFNVLGHFISVKENQTGFKSVVLAIRGTYTPSGLLIDVAEAESKPYCDGLAHSGMADRADWLWDDVKDTICELLMNHPGYDLVITGHSLGAGVATLLALKLNYEGTLGQENPALAGTKVRCFAFAPPPVYYIRNKNTEIMESMKQIYAFIHENDAIPFASVDSVRLLAATVRNVSDRWIPIVSPLRAAGVLPIPNDLKEMILSMGEKNLNPAPGASKLAIPTPFVLWTRKYGYDTHGRPKYNTLFCRPRQEDIQGKTLIGTNNLNILLDENMILDHLPPKYERALYSVREQLIKGDDGVLVFPPHKKVNEDRRLLYFGLPLLCVFLFVLGFFYFCTF